MGENKDRILMCPPDYFTVDYVINPWMAGHEGSMSLNVAKRQWEDLRDAIAEVAEVVTIDPQPELPDMVFTANAGAVYGNKAIASHFMPHERRPEEAHFKTWFRDNGFELLALDEKIGFEGAGDCLHDRRGPWLWTGYGFRTEIEAHEEIRNFFDLEVVSIRLTDERLMAIETRIPPHKRIIVDTIDAGNFACNAVNIGDRVFLHRASDPLKARLMLAGFKVREIELTEFLKAGGSAKCLTLKLNEPLHG
jgi:N-dimethylarginine dimethylaminohydrolase